MFYSSVPLPKVSVPKRRTLICVFYAAVPHKAITQNYTVMCEEPAIDIIDNTQLHYWAIGYDYLAERIQQFDEILLDGYGNALVLNDNSGLYAKIRQMIFDKDAQAKRKQLVAANLIEANEELNQALTTGNDPVYKISTGINVITSLLKAIALSDNILYDPQKRLYTTALAGKTGKRLSGKIDRLLASLTEIGKAGNATAATTYMQIVADCMTEILPIT